MPAEKDYRPSRSESARVKCYNNEMSNYLDIENHAEKSNAPRFISKISFYFVTAIMKHQGQIQDFHWVGAAGSAAPFWPLKGRL